MPLELTRFSLSHIELDPYVVPSPTVSFPKFPKVELTKY